MDSLSGPWYVDWRTYHCSPRKIIGSVSLILTLLETPVESSKDHSHSIHIVKVYPCIVSKKNWIRTKGG